MKEAILAMQRLIDWIDEHAIENPCLIEMSKHNRVILDLSRESKLSFKHVDENDIIISQSL